MKNRRMIVLLLFFLKCTILRVTEISLRKQKVRVYPYLALIHFVYRSSGRLLCFEVAIQNVLIRRAMRARGVCIKLRYLPPCALLLLLPQSSD